MWANTLCPFCSSTRNMALRRHSVTVPSNWIPSVDLGIFWVLLQPDQFEVAARPPAADALEQGSCRCVGLVHVSRCRGDPDAVQRAEDVGQQCPRDALTAPIGAD